MNLYLVAKVAGTLKSPAFVGADSKEKAARAVPRAPGDHIVVWQLGLFPEGFVVTSDIDHLLPVVSESREIT